MEDTICAISTALGVGAISIIRVTGKEAIDIVSKIFKGTNLKKVKSHTIHYGYIFDKNEVVDEVLLSVMRSPKTYTKEDIIEINSHGGINTTNKILELLLEAGCRMASPGEFTKRAFLNGRIDLTQAESVNDLINASSDSQRNLAINNLKGTLNKKIKNLRKDIIDIIANIEVNIDYPEYEDIEIVTKEILVPKLNIILNNLKEMLKDSRNGKIIKEGINIAIIGRPNVGKSSILNRLLDEDKAIVTNTPGTTRDIVEGVISLNGFLINFIDTAGIRDTNDKVEKIGVLKSKKVLKTADLVILVLNGHEKISEDDSKLIKSISKNKRIIFVNKSDLKLKMKLDEDYILGNTVTDNGLSNLKQAIIKKLSLEKINKDMTYLSNTRQIDLLKKAIKSLNDALDNLNLLMPIDMVLIDIKNAWNYLGEITGEVYQDELIATLFSNFCLGK